MGRRTMTEKPPQASDPKFNIRTVSFLARPYEVPRALQDALVSVELRVHPDGELFEGGPLRQPRRIIVSREDAEKSEFDLTIQVNQELVRLGAAELGLPLEALALVVLARNTRLRQEQVVLLKTADNIDSSPIALRLARLVEWMRGSAGLATIDVAVYLVTLQGLQASGAPMRKGTWLASRSFQVTSDSEAFEFDPSPLTETDAQREGIPLSTLVYVAYQDADAEGALHRDQSAKDAVIVYVNKTLLERLVSTTSIQARNIVALLIKQEALQQLVAMISQEAAQASTLPGLPEMLEERTIAGRIVRLMARAKGIDVDEAWMYQLMVDDPLRAQAYCYAAAESSQLLQSYIGLD